MMPTTWQRNWGIDQIESYDEPGRVSDNNPNELKRSFHLMTFTAGDKFKGIEHAAGILVMFDLIVPLSTPHVTLQAPLGIQEMVSSPWLIIAGFNPVVGE